MRPRFTVRRLMVLVVVLAFVLGVARHAVAHWGAGEVTTIAVLVLLATHWLALIAKARWRVFCVGFAVAAWAYLALALVSPLGESLPTSAVLDRLYWSSVHEDDSHGWFRSLYDLRESFVWSGHWVISLLFGALGGGLAVVLIGSRAKVGEVAALPEGSLLEPGWRDQEPGGSAGQPRGQFLP